MSPDDDQSRAALTALAAARRNVYAFLSAGFAQPPSATGLAALRSEAFLTSAAALFGEAIVAQLRPFADAARQADDSSVSARREFMNLFKVPGAQYVTPYESVFRDTRDVAGQPVQGLLMGPSAVAVQKWYKLAALVISEEYRDLPDHICLELDFLASLCGKEEEFSASGDEAKLTRGWEIQRDFLAGHVVSWIGMLRDKIHEKSHHPYFRALADIAVEFTRRDLITLEGTIGPAKGFSTPHYEEVVA